MAGQRIYIIKDNPLDPEDEGGRGFGASPVPSRVGDAFDPSNTSKPPMAWGSDQGYAESRPAWPDPMPFEPKGPVENRIYEKHVGNLTESDLRYWGQKRAGVLPPLDPDPGITPLGRQAGALNLDLQPQGPRVPDFMKKEVDYSTQLSPDEEKDYQKWAKSVGKNTKNEEQDYDLKGYYKDFVRGNPDAPSWIQTLANAHKWKVEKGLEPSEDKGGHLPDIYKKPNHPTFSTGSIYHDFPTDTRYRPIGGKWDKENKIFTPGPSNMEHWDRRTLQNYFAKYEPEYKVQFPSWYR